MPGVLADGPPVRKPVFGLRVKFVQNEMNLRVKLGSAILGNTDGEVDRAYTRRCNRCNCRKSDGGVGYTMGKERLAVVKDIGFIVQRAFETDLEVNAFGRHVTDNRKLHSVLPALPRDTRPAECETDAIGPGHPRIGKGDDTAGDGAGQ